ncbi:tetratricopeptide repeat protein [Flavobacterium selenitireducens]|uniref:tetratricopeptide repeat protein n=1 Tax=Flavobacterium selenitireducens TaxID=2722704 RepID=UPI00168A7C39|nr:tetratricopeptide repeat protein [Flavobacterium selenitireducens]MBD3583520.1 tetratricopeptide repeat protein [Flavobacterium selenitireducens]
MSAIVTLMKTKYTQNNPNYFYLNNWMGELALKNQKSKNASVYESATSYLATHYSGVAIQQFVTGKADKSVGYIDKAITAYRSIGDDYNMYFQYIIKAQFLYRTNQTERAVSCLFDALKYYEKNKANNLSQIAYATSTLANIYAKQAKHKEAITYYKKVIEYYNADPDMAEHAKNNMKVSVYGSMGNSYQQLKMYGEAVECYQKSLALSKKTGDKTNERLVYTKLGMVKLDQNRYDEAETILLEMVNTPMSKLSEAHLNLALGRLYLEKEDFAKASAYAEKGFSISVENKFIDLQESGANFLLKISKGNKDFKRALEIQEFREKLKDSSKVEASKNALAQQQLKYDFEKKELQQKIVQDKKVSDLKLQAQKKAALDSSKNKLARQQLVYDFEKKQLNEKLVQGKKLNAIKLDAEKKTAEKNNLLLGLSSVLVLFSAGGYFYYRNSKQKQSIANLEKNQIKQKLLITQMNPHFIFNSVQNIRSLINNKQNDEAVDYLGKFSTLTRQILENSNENYIALEEEVQMIENYLSIQQLLYDYKFTFTVIVEEDIDVESIFLPPMLAQPFIENAIKHGLSNMSENGKIAVHFFLQQNKLFFEVTDNGKGFDTDKKISNHKSLAMTITKERLVNYTKNKDFVVQTDNLLNPEGKINGAKVVFEVPYIYEN